MPIELDTATHKLLDGRNFATVATLNPDGAPQTSVVWIAREMLRKPWKVKPARLRLVGLWSWFSGQASAFGHSLIEKPWTPGMSFKLICVFDSAAVVRSPFPAIASCL